MCSASYVDVPTSNFKLECCLQCLPKNCVLTSLDEKKEKNMYLRPEEIKDQEIENNKCNYPKSLIPFYEILFV